MAASARVEGPVKATDQFNGQDKHVGEVWKGCILGRVGCCRTGQMGVRSGNEEGMWKQIRSEDVEWVRRLGIMGQVRQVREVGQRVRE